MANIQINRNLIYFLWKVVVCMGNIKNADTIYDIIRRNIKKYRKEKGITSAQLAEMVDLSHDFIRQIESEKTRYNFSVETFYKISVALDVSLDKFVEIEG